MAAVALVFASGCASESTELGDTTTKAAVMGAIEATGYEIAYRDVPVIEGFDTVAGRAMGKKGGRVDFAVVLDLDGSYRGGYETSSGGSPQPPIVRYQEGGATTVGNALYLLEPQSSYTVGHLERFGRAWLPTRDENVMVRRISKAVDGLFEPKVRGAA